MVLSQFIYAFSISLQVAGAVMIMIFAISTNRKVIIRSFASNNVIFEDGDTHKLKYNRDAFISMYRTAYYSKVSVIYIALGYGLGIFGDMAQANCWVVLFIVVLLTTALIILTRCVVGKLLKREIVTNEITKTELENAGCEATIGSASSAEITELFEEPTNKILDEAMRKLEGINDKMKKQDSTNKEE